MNILEQLWHGDICPSEKPYGLSECAENLFDGIQKKKDLLTKKLDEKQLTELDSYSELLNELAEQLEKDAFVNGFRLGAAMMIEILK